MNTPLGCVGYTSLVGRSRVLEMTTLADFIGKKPAHPLLPLPLVLHRRSTCSRKSRLIMDYEVNHSTEMSALTNSSSTYLESAGARYPLLDYLRVKWRVPKIAWGIKSLKTYWALLESPMRIHNHSNRILVLIAIAMTTWTVFELASTINGTKMQGLSYFDRGRLLVAVAFAACWIVFSLVLAMYDCNKQGLHVVHPVLDDFPISIAVNESKYNAGLSAEAPNKRSDSPAAVDVDRSNIGPATTESLHMPATSHKEMQNEPADSAKSEGNTEQIHNSVQLGVGIYCTQSRPQDIQEQQMSHDNKQQPCTPKDVDTRESPYVYHNQGFFEVLLCRRGYGLSTTDTVWANPNVPFTIEDQLVLHNLDSGLMRFKSAFYSYSRHQFPLISLSLVSVKPSIGLFGTHLHSKSTPDTRICISGLRNVNEIQAFDTLMSRSGNRHLYSPLKLCYQNSQIIRSAGPASHNIKSSSIQTMCGSLVTFDEIDRSQRKSTIGGIIEVDGQPFALTTSHRVDKEITTEDEDDPSLADLITAFDSETLGGQESLQPTSSPYMRSLSVAPSLHEDGEVLDASITEKLQPAPLEGLSYGCALTPDLEETWDDWALLSVRPEHCLPNIVPYPSFSSSKEEGRNRQISRFLDFDSMSFDNSLPWPVLIISGVSGTMSGLLSSSPSYMLAETSRPQELWNIRLVQGDLQAGDSGSWVVRESDCSLLGMIVARSNCAAYMVSFAKTKDPFSIGGIMFRVNRFPIRGLLLMNDLQRIQGPEMSQAYLKTANWMSYSIIANESKPSCLKFRSEKSVLSYRMETTNFKWNPEATVTTTVHVESLGGV
ncbi:uncharacterized protein CLUP02_15396 [Colletotrichum lupini]|uniref:Uncharacterized protein n=1 Tax=Colletotrichum lupini TaxID=145971 RepID=A0A9Q8T6F9_9PEZI|nr:uncharacterized protein CLUP02_15396 [Colletotrichum lupini]UQC89865.1 hypothetical protein CLUP02_15396 [Colletotrichum lupini]